jgi:hypothetical protein
MMKKGSEMKVDVEKNKEELIQAFRGWRKKL